MKRTSEGASEVSGDVVSNEVIFLTGEKAKAKYTKHLRKISSGCHAAMG